MDALTLPASVGGEDAHFAVVEGRAAGLQSQLLALPFDGSNVFGLSPFKVPGASPQQGKRHQDDQVT